MMRHVASRWTAWTEWTKVPRPKCIALFFILLHSSFLIAPLRAQFPSACDKDKSCVGNALTITITQGKGAQYVDVDTSYRLDDLGTALTFEAWIAPQPQPGKIQYIAGLW